MKLVSFCQISVGYWAIGRASITYSGCRKYSV